MSRNHETEIKKCQCYNCSKKPVEYIILPYKNGLEHLNANAVVKVSNGLIGKQSFKKIRILQ
jgi:hypothetical protein